MSKKINTVNVLLAVVWILIIIVCAVNLKDFSVDTDNSRRMRELVPKNIIFVSESGVQTAEDVQKLREIGANAVLIGETLMRAENKKAKLSELRGV